MALEPGLSASIELKVEEADTARGMRSGDVSVLATPRIVALMEEASCAAVAGHLQPGHTTVGMRVQVDHVQPTAVGRTVTATATLDRVTGRKLLFSVSANDERGLIAAGKVTRVMVNRERFLEKCG